MNGHEPVQRCLRLVEQLDKNNAWRLLAAQRRHYAERVGALSGRPELAEATLIAMLTYYHTEHTLVEALIDKGSLDHGAAWQLIEGQVRALLAGKLAGGGQGDLAVSLDDLVQEVVADLWRGLPRFRYQSRLQTWVFTVAGHCLNRTIRTRRAHKRANTAKTESLEGLTEALGDALPDLREPTPDEIVQGKALAHLLRQILARHPDQRLATIMQLWVVEERSLREIGARLNLSVGRVHGLLAQAQALLQAHPSLQAWVEHDQSGVEQPGSVGLYIEQAEGKRV